MHAWFGTHQFVGSPSSERSTKASRGHPGSRSRWRSSSERSAGGSTVSSPRRGQRPQDEQPVDATGDDVEREQRVAQVEARVAADVEGTPAAQVVGEGARQLAPLERGEVAEGVIRRGLAAVRQVHVVEPGGELGDLAVVHRLGAR
jgi:hypothetical protein